MKPYKGGRDQRLEIRLTIDEKSKVDEKRGDLSYADFLMKACDMPLLGFKESLKKEVKSVEVKDSKNNLQPMDVIKALTIDNYLEWKEKYINWNTPDEIRIAYFRQEKRLRISQL